MDLDTFNDFLKKSTKHLDLNELEQEELMGLFGEAMNYGAEETIKAFKKYMPKRDYKSPVWGVIA